MVAGSPWSMTASLGPCARPASQAPRPCGRACSPCRSSCAPPKGALLYRRRPAVRACGRRAVRRLALRGRRDIHAHHPDSRHTCPPANRRATRLHEWLPADPPVLRPLLRLRRRTSAHELRPLLGLGGRSARPGRPRVCTVGAGGGGARGTADVATSAAVATGGGSQGTLSSALLPCAPPAWLASCCCVQWGVAEEACGVEGQLPKGVKVVSTAHNVVFMNVTCQAPH